MARKRGFPLWGSHTEKKKKNLCSRFPKNKPGLGTLFYFKTFGIVCPTLGQKWKKKERNKETKKQRNKQRNKQTNKRRKKERNKQTKKDRKKTVRNIATMCQKCVE